MYISGLLLVKLFNMVCIFRLEVIFLEVFESLCLSVGLVEM